MTRDHSIDLQKLRKGTVIDGRYQIEAKIRAGAQGVVYRALDRENKGRCAVKIQLRDEPIERERFRREGEFGRALRHPNLVEVFEMGSWKGRPYLVMEYVDGMLPLDERWPELPWEKFLVVVKQVAAALDFLAGSGLVHRDLSPLNILVGETLAVKVIDLGYARPKESTLTRSSVFEPIGVPGYIAPERLEPSDPDARSDQWALAAIVYETVTGVAPFYDGLLENTIVDEKAMERMTGGEPLRPPSQLNTTVSRELEAVIVTALAYDPNERFPSSGAFAEALARAPVKGLSLPFVRQ